MKLVIRATGYVLAVALFLLPPAAQAAAFSELLKTAPSSAYSVPKTYGVRGEIKIYNNALGRGITVCIARLSRTGLLFAARDRKQSGDKQSIYSEAAAPKDVLVASGGFFGYDEAGHLMPLGLLIDAGRRISRPVRWQSGGMITQGPDGISIVRVADYQADPLVSDALQSKPMLVMDRRNDMPEGESKLSDRIAVGLTERGDVLIIGMFGEQMLGGATLYELAELMRVSGASEALALDGGPSAHIYIPWLKIHLGYSGIYYIPNTLHLRAR